MGYHGGIVDVYRPHLIGEGYYYDVNSLYPTAMCRAMPVGRPTPVPLTVSEFEEGKFFGYLWARVQTPADLYIGLLPIKYQGHLVCPGGTFEGLFFSEELRFALANDFKLLDIQQAWSFQRGENTFRTLIERLNAMKVQAQLNEQPVIRNIAKLMMNSMYGRFGMKMNEGIAAFVTLSGLEELARTSTIIDSIQIGELNLVHYLPNPAPGAQVEGTRKVILPRPLETNVPIAAAITAYSRMIINEMKLEALNAGLHIYYSDTDSLVVNGIMPPHLIDPAELGLMKLEHKIKEGYFVAPP